MMLTACAATLWGFWPRSVLSHETITTTVLFDREIVRILSKRCVACHTEKNLAFPLITYEETRPWARSIEEEALRGNMPPWRAVPGYGEFLNDNALTLRELEFIISWVEGNGPKSAGQTVLYYVSETPSPGVTAMRPEFDHWQLGQPDLLRQLPANVIEAGQLNETKHTVLDLGLSTDRWVHSLEFKPGDRRIVRAAFFWLQETGQWLGSWTPWYGVTMLPEGAAYLIPARSHVVAELHYRGTVERTEDGGTLGLYFSDTLPTNHPSDLVLEAHGDVPANASMHRFRAEAMLAVDTYAIALRPEFLPGVQSIEVAVRRPDGGTQVLLFVKDILPEWPTPYLFKEPVLLPKGTELSVTSYYANTDDVPKPGAIRLTVSRY